ncbi:sigma-70 family RNA polymerase sigma factor [Cohnella cholangitidis]|uniref:Sigma-70 family RNA polymerase sigma factor n=1 Tax=Cohnella cholangitidis TaxID=2598458 RepID=A0A7G5C6L9_9BACL|nr:sigma-70 family RNA polymerase sigma factor [Cohnella cholangitidis]QMV44853.1 sigma-70 family RNA polymerase sigma factor [Cohnella cholangitidis]
MIGDVELARRGDKEAFIRLMRGLEVSLYQTAKAFLHSDEDCADAMQETALRSYRSIRGLKNPRYFKTWIVRILINECKKLLDKRRNVVSFQPEYEPAVADPGYARLELRELVDRLDGPQRSVVLLYYYGDLTVKEIAEELDVPEGTVKSRLYKAREILGSQYDRLSKGVKSL